MIKTIAPLPFKIYSIEDHPNKPAVYDWIRDNWRDFSHCADAHIFQMAKAFDHWFTLDGSLYSLAKVDFCGNYVDHCGCIEAIVLDTGCYCEVAA